MTNQNGGTTYDIHNKGPALTIVQGQRKMKCFMVTESELKQVGLANLLSTISASIGTMLIGFGLDIYKDLRITPGTVATEINSVNNQGDSTAEIEIVAETIQNISFYVGFGFVLGAGLILLWRSSLLKNIKQETAS